MNDLFLTLQMGASREAAINIRFAYFKTSSIFKCNSAAALHLIGKKYGSLNFQIYFTAKYLYLIHVFFRQILSFGVAPCH